MVALTNVVLQMWAPLLCTLLPLPWLRWAELVQPAGAKRPRSSPEVPEDVLVPPLLPTEAWGGGGSFPWRSHGVKLESAWFSISWSVCEASAWLQASHAERPKQGREMRDRAWWGEPCPLRCPPGACFPADILSLQPPPVPWLQEPAEVQPTFATCHGKMSQSLRLLTVTQAQPTHVYLVRGIGAAEKRCTSDWCAKFLFICCKEKLCPLSVSNRQFLTGFFLLLAAIL